MLFSMDVSRLIKQDFKHEVYALAAIIHRSNGSVIIINSDPCRREYECIILIKELQSGYGDTYNPT